MSKCVKDQMVGGKTHLKRLCRKDEFSDKEIDGALAIFWVGVGIPQRMTGEAIYTQWKRTLICKGISPLISPRITMNKEMKIGGKNNKVQGFSSAKLKSQADVIRLGCL